jgi:hypothetical protein
VKLTIYLHLVPRSKNAWSYTSTLQCVFMAWCLVKHSDNFTSAGVLLKELIDRYNVHRFINCTADRNIMLPAGILNYISSNVEM